MKGINEALDTNDKERFITLSNLLKESKVKGNL